MIDLYERGSKKFPWWQDWRGECVAIVGGGPSAKTAGVEKLRDRIHVVVVNEQYQLCPWAEILYSCDADWWVTRRKEVEKFDGIKLTLDDPLQNSKTPGMHKIKIPKHREMWINDFLFDEPGVIGSGGNSGYQMMNQTAQFGVTGMALVGFDMHDRNGIHWHGMHPSPLRNPDRGRFAEWKKDMERSAPKLLQRRIDVVNCSLDSALTCFPKMTIDQMLERWTL